MPRGIFLLDTNVLSDSQKKHPNPTVADWLRRQRKIAVPFPVILEIERGIAEVAAYNPAKAAKLREWMDGFLATDFIHPADTPEVARILGLMYCCGPLKDLWCTEVQSKKRPGQDLFIAAVAIAYGFSIATVNVGDFVRINSKFPLPGLYNPVDGVWAVPALDLRPSVSSVTRPVHHGPPKPIGKAVAVIASPHGARNVDLHRT